MRQAIELLEGAAKRAEAAGRSIIEAKDVQRTVVTMPANVDSLNIENLPPHAMMILLGLCRRLKKEKRDKRRGRKAVSRGMRGI